MTGRSTVIHEFDGYLYCDPWFVFHRSGVGQETVCFPSAMQSGEQSTAGLEICKDPHVFSYLQTPFIMAWREQQTIAANQQHYSRSEM